MTVVAEHAHDLVAALNTSRGYLDMDIGRPFSIVVMRHTGKFNKSQKSADKQNNAAENDPDDLQEFFHSYAYK